MPRHFFLILAGMSIVSLALKTTSHGTGDQVDGQTLSALIEHQYDLENDGRNFLLKEARNSDFFLLGELHGDNEVPGLLRVLWPEMWRWGYHHVAAEVSPWAAHQLEFIPAGKGPEIRALWTREEAAGVHAPADFATSVLWGRDMEEVQPELIIRELAALNPGDSNLKQMTELTRNGYNRKMAP